MIYPIIFHIIYFSALISLVPRIIVFPPPATELKAFKSMIFPRWCHAFLNRLKFVCYLHGLFKGNNNKLIFCGFLRDRCIKTSVCHI